MAAIIVGGVGSYGWQPGGRDQGGHRNYTLSTLVKTSYLDGPATVMSTPGLPITGSVWSLGNDLDGWVFCTPEIRVTPVGRREQDRNEFWRVDQKFSTRPLRRCWDTAIENPLMEPQRVSGNFVRYLKAVTKNRDGTLLKNAAHEPITGPDTEFNDSRPTVHIEQNMSALDLASITSFRDTVNDRTLWGFSARKVLLTGISWEQLVYGVCSYYYRRIFDFEIDFSTFDRETPNWGTMCLQGKWDRTVDPAVWVPDPAADPDDPTHFIRFKDVHSENRRVLLTSDDILFDRPGDPLVDEANINFIDIEHYEESNFLLLGIPAILDP